MHYCEERFLDVARRYGVLGLPARHVPLEDALKAHASQARTRCVCTISSFCLCHPERPVVTWLCARQLFVGHMHGALCKRMHDSLHAASQVKHEGLGLLHKAPLEIMVLRACLIVEAPVSAPLCE